MYDWNYIIYAKDDFIKKNGILKITNAYIDQSFNGFQSIVIDVYKNIIKEVLFVIYNALVHLVFQAEAV